jgi:hypothetical protein
VIVDLLLLLARRIAQKICTGRSSDRSWSDSPGRGWSRTANASLRARPRSTSRTTPRPSTFRSDVDSARQPRMQRRKKEIARILLRLGLQALRPPAARPQEPRERDRGLRSIDVVRAASTSGSGRRDPEPRRCLLPFKKGFVHRRGNGLPMFGGRAQGGCRVARRDSSRRPRGQVLEPSTDGWDPDKADERRDGATSSRSPPRRSCRPQRSRLTASRLRFAPHHNTVQLDCPTGPCVFGVVLLNLLAG